MPPYSGAPELQPATVNPMKTAAARRIGASANGHLRLGDEHLARALVDGVVVRHDGHLVVGPDPDACRLNSADPDDGDPRVVSGTVLATQDLLELDPAAVEDASGLLRLV